MRKKKLSQSNAETEGGEEEEQQLTVNTLLEQHPPIVDVWNYNFKEELAVICSLA
jgi:hypothetical protein